MDQDRSDLSPPEADPLEKSEGGTIGRPAETGPRLPPQGPTSVGDEGEDHGFGERPAGSEDGSPGSALEPRPTEESPQEGDQGVGSGGD